MNGLDTRIMMDIAAVHESEETRDVEDQHRSWSRWRRMYASATTLWKSGLEMIPMQV